MIASPALLLAAALGGYLLGSIPFGVIITRLGGAGDVRAIGSGNIGATNVLRTGRRDLALLTLLADGGKGAVAVLVARAVFGEWATGWAGVAGAVAGAAAFLGHLFPVWLNFKGGKGVATFYGVMFAAAWPVGLAAAAWLATARVMRFSSLAALTAAAISPGLCLALRSPRHMIWLASFLAALIFLRHTANIARLRAGTEPRIGADASGPVASPGLTPVPATATAVERRDRLRLARTDSVGPVTYARLMERYGSAARALDALPRLAERGGRGAPLKATTVVEAQRELEAGEAMGARLLTAGEPDYPAPLAAVDPPPPVLWALGHPGLLLRTCVAVVGARVASSAGQRFARQLAAELGQAGLTVVSGLARGVDGAAHEGSLPFGAAAVLGGGVDDVYPPEHADLHRRLAAEGCIVSENAIGRRAKAQDFPRRNRIISGLSLAVVVVEAELRSGSLITARLANEQGREVLAVPGSPLDPRAKGPNDLIRRGAALCEGAEDVLEAIRGAASTLREPQGDLFAPPAVDQGDLDRAADALRGRVHALLSPTPTPCDEVVRTLGAPTPAVLAALVELALAGRAELLPGGLVCRI